MRIADMIDRYLRNEMTNKELLQFEQQAMNDVTLRREVELVYTIKRRLAARQEKLRRMKEWSGRRRHAILRYGVAASVAAVAVAALVGYRHAGAGDMVADNVVTVAGVRTESVGNATHETSADRVTPSVTVVMDRSADSDVASDKGKPAVSADMERKFAALHGSTGSAEHNYMSAGDYERDWKHIITLLHNDNYTELIPLLEAFVQISGRHQSAADSLLQRCQGRRHETFRR